MKNPNKRSRNAEVRLIPAVIGVGAILLMLKAGGLAFGAHAQTAAPQKAPAAAPATPAKPPMVAPAKPAVPATKPAGADPLAAIDAALPMPPNKPGLAAQVNPAPPSDTVASDLEGAGVSPAEMDVLSSLSDRRDALDERQRQLDLRAQTIAAAEKRVDGKIAELKALQAKIEALLGQRNQMETAQLDSLVKIYSAMKPKDAARVMTSLDDAVRLNVSGRMKPDVMAGILTALPADVAQKLTVELAGQYKMNTETAGAAAAETNAAAAPASPAAQKPAAPGG